MIIRALYVGLIAGAVLLHTGSGIAAEGSSLRGLKPPNEGLEPSAISQELSGTPPGLKWPSIDNLPDFGGAFLRYGGSFQTQHFESSSTDFRSALYRPLGQQPSPLGDGSLNPLHDGLPKYSLYNQFNQSLPAGWGLGFGVRHSEYNFATTNLVALTAERYVGHFRGAYTLYSNRVEGSSIGSAQRFQVNYFYGDRNTVGLAYTTGRDIESIGLSVGLPLADARDWTLSGRHWLSPNWAVTYDVLSQEQVSSGSLYRRQGLRLGVSRTF